MYTKPILGQPINWAHPLAKGLIGCWIMNESSGDKIYDLGTKRRNGSLHSAGGRPIPSWESGFLGPAVHFHDDIYIWARMWGSEKEYCVGDSFSVIFGVKFTIVQEASILGQDEGGGNNLKWMVVWDSITNNNLTFHWQNPAGTGYQIDWPWIPIVNTWYDICITREDSNWNLYVKGKPIGAPQTQAALVPAVNVDLHLGTEGENWKYLYGSLSNVRIYDRGLNAAEVLQNYQEPYAIFKPTFNILVTPGITLFSVVPTGYHHLKQAGGA